jgi:hypothetical protein
MFCPDFNMNFQLRDLCKLLFNVVPATRDTFSGAVEILELIPLGVGVGVEAPPPFSHPVNVKKN